MTCSLAILVPAAGVSTTLRVYTPTSAKTVHRTVFFRTSSGSPSFSTPLKENSNRAKMLRCYFGAGGGGRTRTLSPGPDFESGTSANSITPAFKLGYPKIGYPMVLVTGLEPVRYYYRGILSPLRLPISPHQRTHNIIH